MFDDALDFDDPAGTSQASVVDENPFLQEEPEITPSVPVGLPLLRATKDLLGGAPTTDDPLPSDIGALEREVRAAPFYAHLELDLLGFDRAVEAKDWTRARVAARRILRSGENVNVKCPPDLVDLARDVDLAQDATGEDRRAFHGALANGDHTMARLLGHQIIEFSSTTRLVDV